jgi:HEAT repeat protein
MKAISSPIWQMRARAAKLVGKNCDGSFAWVLEPLLNDENVWVRFRAAEGLINLGKIGIDLLKETSFPQAIELAKQQLMLMDKRNEEKR